MRQLCCETSVYKSINKESICSDSSNGFLLSVCMFYIHDVQTADPKLWRVRWSRQDGGDQCSCMKGVILSFHVLQCGGTYFSCFSFYRMFSYGEFKAEDQVIIHLTAMAFYRQGKITVTMKY